MAGRQRLVDTAPGGAPGIRAETRDAADQPAVSVLGSPHHKRLSAPNVNPTSLRNLIWERN